MKRLLAMALIVVACGGRGATPQIVYITPEPATTDAALPVSPITETGVITFGTTYNPDTLSIEKPVSRFKRTFPEIAWSAVMSRTIDATTITWVIASQSKTGVEVTLISQEQTVGNPDFDTLANSANLAFLVDNKPGTYVMRYIESGDTLAEGTFTLVK